MGCSLKSDVFSFGILVLEIICGKKNRRLYNTNRNLKLVGHVRASFVFNLCMSNQNVNATIFINIIFMLQARRIWKEGRALELVDSKIKELCIESEVSRCLHISLLCVQQNPEDRPTMASVILMFESHMEHLLRNMF